MRRLLNISLVIFFSLFLASGSYALDSAAIIKGLGLEITSAKQLLILKGDDFAARATQSLNTVLSSLKELSPAVDLRSRVQSCIELADRAKASLLQQDYKVALNIVRSLLVEVKSLSNPISEFNVWVASAMKMDDAEVFASRAAEMLKLANQNILGIKILTKFVGGNAKSAVVRYACRYPITDAVEKAKSIDKFCIGKSLDGYTYIRLKERVSDLSSRGLLVLNVVPTVYDNSGRITWADIWTIPFEKYEEIRKQF
ncbi:MAG: hypothetical protein WA705_03455 [Candidatus Ozemobacteraceae bacterium]